MSDTPNLDPLDTRSIFAEEEVAPAKPTEQRTYQVIGDGRIPVSKARGKLWKSRRDTAAKSLADISAAWTEATNYYNQSQQASRNDRDTPLSSKRYAKRTLGSENLMNENIVYANIRAQVPTLYAKNPVIEVSAPKAYSSSQPVPGAPPVEPDTPMELLARATEKLVNVLFGMAVAPGINLKPKAKKAVTLALLTDVVWFEVGYNKKEQSSEAAFQDLQVLSDALTKAKTADEIREIEGKLQALEKRMDFLLPAGPWCKVKHPSEVLIDPDAEDLSLTDAAWAMYPGYLPTPFVRAAYMRKKGNGDGVDYELLYKPTHMLNGDAQGEKESFSLFEDKPYVEAGFSSQEAMDSAARTKVWYVWDRTTQRLELYHDKEWDWPLWVWDNPYQLDQFFPLAALVLTGSPTDRYSKGSASYYLDQQDMLNEIMSERRLALEWARKNVFFDSNVTDQSIVEKVLYGKKRFVQGIAVPDGKTLKDIIFSVPPPSAAFMQMFETNGLYQSIARIDGTNEAMRGGEFRTNTTNQAIDYYASTGSGRSDERRDAIEDTLGKVGWLIAQLCWRFMSPEEVMELTGLDVSAYWRPLDRRDLAQLSMRCVGGSTRKSSAEAKKQEAMEVGRILAQFAQVAPGPVVTVTLRMLSDAFDGTQMTKEDWDALNTQLQALAASDRAGPAGGRPRGGSIPGGRPASPSPQPQSPGANNAGGTQVVMMLVEALSALPPPALQAIGQALAQGVTPEQIAQQLLQEG